MIIAIRGKSSQMSTPGTAVDMDLNGPPVGLPGLGSHVSNWLEPPANHTKSTRLFCFRSSSAQARLYGAASPPSIAPAEANPAPCKKPRRLQLACPADVGQASFVFMA
jgi:hypothetical protein